jgi:hypothetical protein
LRCYAELNDHLPPARRQREQVVRLRPPATLADLIETQGIPPGTVELALVNGRPATLDRPLVDGDRVSLYPLFEALDLTPVPRPRPRPLRRPRFVADAHLGGLARYLRLLGFDTRFENDPGDDALAEISATEHRILLSRDLGLLARRRVTHGLWVPETRPREQLAWLVDRLDLYRLFRPFTRCMPCNGALEAVTREQVRDLVPARVLAAFERFWRCRGCGRIYWRGSHYERLVAFVERLAGRGRATPGVVHGPAAGLSCAARDRVPGRADPRRL